MFLVSTLCVTDTKHLKLISLMMIIMIIFEYCRLLFFYFYFRTKTKALVHYSLATCPRSTLLHPPRTRIPDARAPKRRRIHHRRHPQRPTEHAINYKIRYSYSKRHGSYSHVYQLFTFTTNLLIFSTTFAIYSNKSTPFVMLM